MSTISKGNFLEDLITKLCSDLINAKIEKNKKIKGKSGTVRQIDTYIEGEVGNFKVKINVESKNYDTKIGIDKVDALIGKIQDTGIDIGILVSAKGFTKGAIERAISGNIQLVEPVSEELNNHLLVPVGLIIPEIKSYSFGFSGSSKHGGIFIPIDLTRVRTRVGTNHYNLEQLLSYIWNQHTIPRIPGEYSLPMNAMSIADVDDLDDFCYVELTINVKVIEKYYLRIIPINGLKNITPGKEKNRYKIRIDINSQDMSNWQKFNSIEELKKAQKEFPNQTKEIQDYTIYADYLIKI